MNYLELLGLSREPFSTSPDPLAYYRAPGHELCLHRLEIAVRLRRGLNVVLGDVGTGKSTLCRCLLRAFAEQPEVTAHLILDPGFASAEAFALHLRDLLAGAGATAGNAAEPEGEGGQPQPQGARHNGDEAAPAIPASPSPQSAPAAQPVQTAQPVQPVQSRQLPPLAPLQADMPAGSELLRTTVESIQAELLRLTQEQGRIVVLCIDEGQKMLPECLEVLRQLLNFETNTEKLLQIVIFGQRELEATIAALPNFRDRINEYLPLRPLSLRETIRLVRYRLRLAGGPAAERMFSLSALLAVHGATGGYPRKIMRLCHQLVMNLLINNRRRVTWREVHAFARRDAGLGGRLEAESPESRGLRMAVRGLMAALVLALLAGGLGLAGWRILPADGLRVSATSPGTAPVVPSGTTDAAPALPSPVPPSFVMPAPGVPASGAPTGGEGTPLQADDSAERGPFSVFRPLLAALGLQAAEHAPEGATQPEARATAAPRPQTEPQTGQQTAGAASATIAAQQAAEPPARLGLVVLPRGETLLGLLDAVYGRSSVALDAVMRANPAIENPNRLPADTILALPAIVMEPGMARRSQCALLLEGHATVEEAYRAWRALGGSRKDVVLAPIWKADRGLRFYLMPSRFYAKAADARAAAEQYASRFPSATVEAAFGEGAVFYRRFD